MLATEGTLKAIEETSGIKKIVDKVDVQTADGDNVTLGAAADEANVNTIMGKLKQVLVELQAIKTRLQNDDVVLSNLNLDGVEVATVGAGVETGNFSQKTVLIDVTTTGSVKVEIEISPDGVTWFPYYQDTIVLTRTLLVQVPEYVPFIRTLTDEQTDSTVTTYIMGRGR